MATLTTVQPSVVQKQVSTKPLYREMWAQVVFAMLVAVVLGYLSPARAVAMKPLGDAFIRLISMIISLIIFCTVVTGIAGMENLKKVGRVFRNHFTGQQFLHPISHVPLLRSCDRGINGDDQGRRPCHPRSLDSC